MNCMPHSFIIHAVIYGNLIQSPWRVVKKLNYATLGYTTLLRRGFASEHTPIPNLEDHATSSRHQRIVMHLSITPCDVTPFSLVGRTHQWP